jgi:hypothetical protein
LVKVESFKSFLEQWTSERAQGLSISLNLPLTASFISQGDEMEERLQAAGPSEGGVHARWENASCLLFAHAERQKRPVSLFSLL